MTLEESLLADVERTKGERSTSARVNELLRRARRSGAGGGTGAGSRAVLLRHARQAGRTRVPEGVITFHGEGLNSVPAPVPAGWFPRRGEMCLVRLDKDRPALVISADVLNRHALDVCIVPITSIEHRRFSLRVPLRPGEGGLDRASWAKCDQVTTLEKNLVRYPPLGRLSATTLSKIEAAIKTAVDLP